MQADANHLNGSSPLHGRPMTLEQPARLLGLRRSAWLELAVLLGVAYLVDFVWFGGERFTHWTPHPLWLVVLMFGVQYGLAEGCVAVVLCTAFLWAGNLPPPVTGQDDIAYLWQLSQLPLLWTVTTIVIGGLRQRQLAERRELVARLAQSEQHRDRLHQAYSQLRHAKHQLDVRLATRANLAARTFDTVMTLCSAQDQERDAALGDLVREWTGARAFSVFIVDGDVLRRHLQVGGSDDMPGCREYGAGSPLFQAVIGNQRRVVVCESADETILGQDGVAAGPLLDMRTHRVVGMLKIEDIDLASLDAALLERFDTLCQWIGSVLAQSVAAPKTAHLVSVGTTTLPVQDESMRRRIEFLHELSQRVGFEVSVVSISPELTEDLKPAARVIIQSALKTAVSRLRRADRALPLDAHGRGAVVLLAGTSLDHAHRVARKLRLATLRHLPEELRGVPLQVQVGRLSQLIPRNAA